MTNPSNTSATDRTPRPHVPETAWAVEESERLLAEHIAYQAGVAWFWLEMEDGWQLKYRSTERRNRR